MSSQAQIQAAEKFKAPEASAITGKEAEEETAAADGGEESEGEEVCGSGEREGEGKGEREKEREEGEKYSYSINSFSAAIRTASSLCSILFISEAECIFTMLCVS